MCHLDAIVGVCGGSFWEKMTNIELELTMKEIDVESCTHSSCIIQG